MTYSAWNPAPSTIPQSDPDWFIPAQFTEAIEV